MGLILEDIINQHGLYITTNTDFTYQQSTKVSNSGKSTIDLTHRLKNIKVVTKNKAQGYWNPDWAGTLIQAKSKVQNKKCWLGEMDTVSSSASRRLFYKLPLRISEKVIDQHAKKLTDQIVGSATSVFGLTEISNKRAKGWRNSNIKAARKEMK